MSKTNEHGRLIATAAKAALLPLGCRRKGQSRLWYCDQRFWVISIEFQPSGWSKGSYLNVGVKWLWHAGPGLDLSDRPVDFIPFESAEQFTPLIENMAERAAQEVLTLRDRFKSFADVHRYLVTHATRDGLPIYHAAIAVALAGDIAAAQQFFHRMEQWPTYGYASEQKLKAESAALAELLHRPARFRSAILDIIQHSRGLIGLLPDHGCLDELDSTAGQ